MGEGNNGMGCKMLLLIFGGLAIFGFFAAMMNVSQGLASSISARQRRMDTTRDFSLLIAGMQAYTADHKGKLPPLTGAESMQSALYPKYVAQPDAFTRVGDDAVYQPNPALAEKPLGDYEKTLASTIVLYEPSPTRDKTPARTILYLSGKSARVAESDWEIIRQANALP